MVGTGDLWNRMLTAFNDRRDDWRARRSCCVRGDSAFSVLCLRSGIQNLDPFEVHAARSTFFDSLVQHNCTPNELPYTVSI